MYDLTFSFPGFRCICWVSRSQCESLPCSLQIQ